jgi:hypothetical protein
VIPRRTHVSDSVLTLPGHSEDSDLWVCTYDVDEGGPAQGSVWELTLDERKAIRGGANVELVVYGRVHPPVALRLSTYPLGRAPA